MLLNFFSNMAFGGFLAEHMQNGYSDYFPFAGPSFMLLTLSFVLKSASASLNERLN